MVLQTITTRGSPSCGFWGGNSGAARQGPLRWGTENEKIGAEQNEIAEGEVWEL